MSDTGSGRRRRSHDEGEPSNRTQELSDLADEAAGHVGDEEDDETNDATDDDERVEKGMRTMESAQLTALFKRHGFETIAKCNIEKPFLSEFEMTEVGKQEAAERAFHLRSSTKARLLCARRSRRPNTRLLPRPGRVS